MAFVNERISPADRERYQLANFEKGLSFINPGYDWAIDREQDIFLRVINPAARGSEPADPDARFEHDFQFYWKGYSCFVSTRRIGSKELLTYSGEIFQSDNLHEEGATVLRFYLRHIGEVSKPTPDAPSALITQRQQVLSDLEYVLAFGFGGTFSSISPEGAAQSRYAILKIAPHAEVVA